MGRLCREASELDNLFVYCYFIFFHDSVIVLRFPRAFCAAPTELHKMHVSHMNLMYYEIMSRFIKTVIFWFKGAIKRYKDKWSCE